MSIHPRQGLLLPADVFLNGISEHVTSSSKHFIGYLIATRVVMISIH